MPRYVEFQGRYAWIGVQAILLIAMMLAIAQPVCAADHWHRAHNGGQDLTQADGTVVAMVRYQSGDWIGIIAHEIGSEGWDILGTYPTMHEAKAAVMAKMQASDAGDEP